MASNTYDGFLILNEGGKMSDEKNTQTCLRSSHPNVGVSSFFVNEIKVTKSLFDEVNKFLVKIRIAHDALKEIMDAEDFRGNYLGSVEMRKLAEKSLGEMSD